VTFDDFAVSSLMDITPRPELVFVSGQGSWLTDHTGKRYLDFVQGWAVNCLGHAPKIVVDALTAQASLLISPSPAFYNQPMLELASLICRTSGLGRVFFCNSGAEANEGAIKLARRWGRKNRGGAYEIITFDGSFHGRTLATMSASGKPGWDSLFAPQVPGFPKATLNDPASVDRLIGKNTVAVMIEPIQGEGGVIPATLDFMRALRRLTRERGLLLIADEIQTGIGRLGTLYGWQTFQDKDGDLRPDIMTLGKGLGGGVPIAALVAKAEVSVFDHGDQGGTFNGNPLMCAVGQAVLSEVAKPAFLAHVQTVGEYLGEQLKGLSAELGLGPERGKGLLRALDLGANLAAPDVVAAAREAGFLLNAPRPAALRFMPSLTVSTSEIDQMIDGLRAAIVRVRGASTARAA